VALHQVLERLLHQPLALASSALVASSSSRIADRAGSRARWRCAGVPRRGGCRARREGLESLGSRRMNSSAAAASRPPRLRVARVGPAVADVLARARREQHVSCGTRRCAGARLRSAAAMSTPSMRTRRTAGRRSAAAAGTSCSCRRPTVPRRRRSRRADARSKPSSAGVPVERVAEAYVLEADLARPGSGSGTDRQGDDARLGVLQLDQSLHRAGGALDLAHISLSDAADTPRRPHRAGTGSARAVIRPPITSWRPPTHEVMARRSSSWRPGQRRTHPGAPHGDAKESSTGRRAMAFCFSSVKACTVWIAFSVSSASPLVSRWSCEVRESLRTRRRGSRAARSAADHDDDDRVSFRLVTASMTRLPATR